MNDRYGVLAEFRTSDELLHATRRAWEKGYRRMDAYSPFPVEGLAEALGFHRTAVPAVVFLGGVFGAVLGYAMQVWMNVVDYPLNVGGRPLNSIPAWIIIMFELTILLGASFAVLGMLALNRLPEPYHPVFNVPAFARASSDRFFLSIEASDPLAASENPRAFLEALRPEGVWDVET
jgi:hypothetical protein